MHIVCMLGVINQRFIALVQLGFVRLLTTKSLSMNNQPCRVKTTHTLSQNMAKHTEQNILCVNADVNSMIENVIQNKSGITISLSVSVRNQ